MKTTQTRLPRSEPVASSGFRLTPRDREIVKAVYAYRALTTPQIQALLFSPHASRPDTRCKRRLHLLHAAGLLFRDEQPTKLSEGRKPLVYFLAAGGTQLLAELLDVDRHEIDWTPKHNNVTWLYLEHLLRTNDIRVSISTCAKRHGWTITRWLDDRALKRQRRDVVEITGPSGGRQKVAIVPDGYFALQIGTRTYRRFIEADLGTVTAASSKEGRRDWTRRIRAFLAYRRSGLYEKRYGSKVFRVWTVTTTAKRLETLLNVTKAAGGGELFSFTTFDALRGADALTDPVWRQPGSERLVPAITLD